MAKILHIDTDQEIWKSITGYEGMYEISNFGRVMSLEKTVSSKAGSVQVRPERFLKPTIGTNGYYKFVLCFETNKKDRSLHRLVAIEFIPNPNNYPQINHIDGNKLNNELTNLEWCNNSHNQLEAFKNGQQMPSFGMLGKVGKLCKNSKAVIQMNIEGEFIAEFESTVDAERKTGICHSNIVRHIGGYGKSCGGYKWKYKEAVNG